MARRGTGRHTTLLCRNLHTSKSFMRVDVWYSNLTEWTTKVFFHVGLVEPSRLANHDFATRLSDENSMTTVLPLGRQRLMYGGWVAFRPPPSPPAVPTLFAFASPTAVMPELTSWLSDIPHSTPSCGVATCLCTRVLGPPPPPRATILPLLARRCNARRHAECGAAVSYVRFITYADVLQAHDLLAVR